MLGSLEPPRCSAAIKMGKVFSRKASACTVHVAARAQHLQFKALKAQIRQPYYRGPESWPEAEWGPHSGAADHEDAQARQTFKPDGESAARIKPRTWGRWPPNRLSSSWERLALFYWTMMEVKPPNPQHSPAAGKDQCPPSLPTPRAAAGGLAAGRKGISYSQAPGQWQGSAASPLPAVPQQRQV